MNSVDALTSHSINVMQSGPDKLKTQLKVDAFNEHVLQGKKKNAETQKQEFLQILVTQLQNQNPLEPLNDKEFIAQMAQLTSLEKLEGINERLEKLTNITDNASLFHLIGKRVNYLDNMGQESFGVVDSIDLREGKGFISVDGKITDIKNIMKVQQGLGASLGNSAQAHNEN